MTKGQYIKYNNAIRMNSIGQELKKQRELKNISLEDIAKEIKISLRFLHAIEEDNFNILPEGVYRRNFIASYANYIGADVTGILNRYKELYEKTTTHKMKAKNYPTTNKYIDYIVAVAIILVIVFVIFFYKNGSKNNNIGSEKIKLTKNNIVNNLNKGIEDQQKSSADPNQKNSISDDKSLVKKEYAGLQLLIIVEEDTWLEIQKDDEIVYKWLLKKGDRKKFNADNRIVFNKIGNASGVKIFCNGIEFQPLGKKGEVVKNIILTPDNITSYAIHSK